MKNLFLTTPSFSRNGGIRVILEWANRLSDSYNVYLRILNRDPVPNWFTLKPNVKVIRTDNFLPHCHLCIITSPHSIHYAKQFKGKKIIFLQMLEHLFRPRDEAWLEECRKTYTSDLPMICISQWNMEILKGAFGRTAPTYYVGNGVNLNDFPIEVRPKTEKVVLVEGWVAHNRSKDCDHCAPLAAKRLRDELGYKIITYSAHAPSGPYKHLPDEYHTAPDLAELNRLYSRAAIMLKASKYDARSCAPMEAMTKGTVTVRAIISGDDDLRHGYNCVRTPYNEYLLYVAARELLTHVEVNKLLSRHCVDYVKAYSWDYWMKKIKDILNTL